MLQICFDALGACGFVLLFAARRRRVRGAPGEPALRRAGGILLGVAAVGRIAAGLAAIGRPPG